jgi:intracellular septation protein
MKWLLGGIEELLPVLAFFLMQSWYGFTAGVVTMVMTMVALLLFVFVQGKKTPLFAAVSTVLVLLFVIPTVVTGDAAWFQVSDTVLDGGFALILLTSFWLKYPLLKKFFGRIFAITDEAWHTLSLRWGILFLILATTNEYIRVTYSEDVWSWYKLLSTIGILLFGSYQFVLSARMRIIDESNWLGLRTRTPD